jgi:hypothetical protein
MPVLRAAALVCALFAVAATPALADVHAVDDLALTLVAGT